MKSTTYFRLALVFPLPFLWSMSNLPGKNAEVISSISEFAFTIGWIPYIALYLWFIYWSKLKGSDQIQAAIDWLPFINLIPLFIYIFIFFGTSDLIAISQTSLVLETIQAIFIFILIVSFFALIIGYIFIILINICYSLLNNNGVIINAKP